MDKCVLYKKMPKPTKGRQAVKLTWEMHDRLTELKEETGLSYCEMVDQLLRFGLKHLEIREPEEG